MCKPLSYPKRAVIGSAALRRSAGLALILYSTANAGFGADSLNSSCKSATRSAPDAAAAKIKIVLVGDSTVEIAHGWGPGFAKLLAPTAQCVNWARGGRSSKSFMAEGLWKKALAEKPDYVLIQFGHNDQPGKGPERETDPKTTYPELMSKYVDESRAAGAQPVLITSLSRRNFGPNGKIRSSLTDYVNAVKQLAREKDVPLIDLHAKSIELLDTLGPKDSAAFDPNPNPDPKNKGPDKTHLSPKGQEVFGQMVADQLKTVVPALAPYFKTAGASH